MTDPLSITTGVVALLGTCITVTTAIKGFCDGVAIIDVKVSGLLTDVEGFTQVLQMMRESLQEDRVKSSLQATGHIGNHWANVSKSIKDGQNTIVKLQATLEKVNKSVAILDGARKHLRLKAALDEITMFQQQIRSYRDTIQLSLQTVILWNQITTKESNDKILPNLDEIHDTIRRVAFDINSRMMTLQSLVESNTKFEQIQTLTNLRNCVQSAASAVSSASTTLGIDYRDNFSATYGSEFGECFPSQPSEAMMRWVSSKTVYEFEEEDLQAAAAFQPRRTSNGKGIQQDDENNGSDSSDHSDSDSELEVAKIQALLKQAREKFNREDFESAERLYRNCLTRTTSTFVQSSTHRASKLEIMDLLAKTCMQRAKWSEAQSILLEKIALRSRSTSGDTSAILSDIMTLTHIFLNQSAYSEAILYARRAYKGYRRMGSAGNTGVTEALGLLVQISHKEGNIDEEEAYLAILSEFAGQQTYPPGNEGVAETSSSTNLSPGTDTFSLREESHLEDTSKPGLDRLNSVAVEPLQKFLTPSPRAGLSSYKQIEIRKADARSGEEINDVERVAEAMVQGGDIPSDEVNFGKLIPADGRTSRLKPQSALDFEKTREVRKTSTGSPAKGLWSEDTDQEGYERSSEDSHSGVHNDLLRVDSDFESITSAGVDPRNIGSCERENFEISSSLTQGAASHTLPLALDDQSSMRRLPLDLPTHMRKAVAVPMSQVSQPLEGPSLIFDKSPTTLFMYCSRGSEWWEWVGLTYAYCEEDQSYISSRTLHDLHLRPLDPPWRYIWLKWTSNRAITSYRTKFLVIDDDEMEVDVVLGRKRNDDVFNLQDTVMTTIGPTPKPDPIGNEVSGITKKLTLNGNQEVEALRRIFDQEPLDMGNNSEFRNLQEAKLVQILDGQSDDTAQVMESSSSAGSYSEPAQEPGGEVSRLDTSNTRSSGPEASGVMRVQSYVANLRARYGSSPAEHWRKVVIVGDSCIGKTCLLLLISSGIIPEVYESSVFGVHHADIEVGEDRVELALWDTSGVHRNNCVRPRLFPGSDIILLCFAIDDPASFGNIQSEWINQVSNSSPRVPIILVGTKKDLRKDGWTVDKLLKSSTQAISPRQGEDLRRKIGAYEYLECSTKTGEGVIEVFQHAARIALLKPKSIVEPSKQKMNRKKTRWTLFGKQIY